jgi:hypothetical protein
MCKKRPGRVAKTLLSRFDSSEDNILDFDKFLEEMRSPIVPKMLKEKSTIVKIKGKFDLKLRLNKIVERKL